MLTKARIRAVGRCRAVGDKDRRRVAAAFSDGVDAGGCSGLLGSTGSFVEFL